MPSCQIINSIQQGLAAELDFQAIVDLVGDKLREVLNHSLTSQSIGTMKKLNLIHYLYVYEHGSSANSFRWNCSTFWRDIEYPIENTPTACFQSNPADYAKLNALAAPGTDQSKSWS